MGRQVARGRATGPHHWPRRRTRARETAAPLRRHRHDDHDDPGRKRETPAEDGGRGKEQADAGTPQDSEGTGANASGPPPAGWRAARPRNRAGIGRGSEEAWPREPVGHGSPREWEYSEAAGAEGSFPTSTSVTSTQILAGAAQHGAGLLVAVQREHGPVHDPIDFLSHVLTPWFRGPSRRRVFLRCPPPPHARLVSGPRAGPLRPAHRWPGAQTWSRRSR